MSIYKSHQLKMLYIPHIMLLHTVFTENKLFVKDWKCLDS